MKEKIWSTIQNLILENKMDPAQLPLINRFSDHHTWYKAMKPLIREKPDCPVYVRLLTQNATVTQILISSSVDIPDEVHDDTRESFMILEGECNCHVGSQIINLKAGGYLEVPLHEHHNVELVSGKVVAVLQRISLAE